MGLHFNNTGMMGVMGSVGTQGCIGLQGNQGFQGPRPEFVNNKYVCLCIDNRIFSPADLILNDTYYCNLIDNTENNKKWNRRDESYYHVWDISKKFLGNSLVENFITLAEFREIRINKILE